MDDSLFKKKDKGIILTDILMGIMLLIWKLLWISVYQTKVWHYPVTCDCLGRAILSI